MAPTWSHIAIAIGANCVRNGARVRFFTAVDLVNQLEAEDHAGKAGKLADELVRVISSFSTNSATCRSRSAAGRCCFI
jgi:DNA replication protein DnaC